MSRTSLALSSTALLGLVAAGCAHPERAEDVNTHAVRDMAAPAAQQVAGVRVDQGAPNVARGIEPMPQRLVDRSLSALRTIEASAGAPAFRNYLARAEGVLVVPDVARDALEVGSEGAGGVLLAEQPDGSLSRPAFYSIGPGATGVALGFDRADIVLFLMNDAAVAAALGGGLDSMGLAQGSLSPEDHLEPPGAAADVISLVASGGVLHPGPSFGGAVIRPVPSLNAAYYGPGFEPEAVIRGEAISNEGADALVDALGAMAKPADSRARGDDR